MFFEEAGFQLLATLRRTRAPRGGPPIHQHPCGHDKLSALSALTVSPRRRRLGLVLVLLPDNENVHGEEGVAALRTLHRHHPGPLTVLWDRSRTHSRSRAAQAYLARHPEIVTGECPSYAPELDPAEPIWLHLKSHTLAHYAPPHLGALRACWEQEARKLRRRPGLLAAFIKHAELTL